MNKFSIDSRVVEKRLLRAKYSYQIGKVIAITPNNIYIVQIYEKDETWDSPVAQYKEDELLSEKEAALEQARLDAELDAFQAEFELIRNQLQSKLNQAADLVKEAANLAAACKQDFSKLRNECRPLFTALNKAGWSASSMKC